MGKKDIAEKTLLDWNDVFADVFNSLLFNGEQIMRPEELENVSPHSAYKAEKDQKGEPHEQIRDVVKLWRNTEYRIAFCGIENQTDVDHYMPLRVIGYDGATYRSQLLGKNPTQPCPVVTLVLYFGKGLWTGPRSLKECMKIPDYLSKYVSDYHINVIEVGQLRPEQIEVMKSDFRIIADFFAQYEKTGDYIADSDTVFHHPEDTLRFFFVFTNDNRFTGKEIGANTMCEFLDKVENRGIEKGRAEGLTIAIKAIMDKMQVSFEEALSILGIPDTEKERYIHSIS